MERLEHTWTPGWSVAGDEEVRAGNDCLGCRAGDRDGCLFNAVDAAWNGCTVDRKNAGVGEQPGHHEGRADEEGWTTANAVNPDQGRNRHNHVDDVLNGRRDEQSVARQACHGEDVSNL